MNFFSKVCGVVSDFAGRPISFLLSLSFILLWCGTGPCFHFSDTWQLVINTTTTIITFLMVFLIQNTQNREGKAIQLKLHELIRSIDGAHNALLNLEDLSSDEISDVNEQYKRIALQARRDLKLGKQDTGTPDTMRIKAERAAKSSRRIRFGRTSAPGRDEEESSGISDKGLDHCGSLTYERK